MRPLYILDERKIVPYIYNYSAVPTSALYSGLPAHRSISLARSTGNGCDSCLVCAFLKYHPMGLLVA